MALNQEPDSRGKGHHRKMIQKTATVTIILNGHVHKPHAILVSRDQTRETHSPSVTWRGGECAGRRSPLPRFHAP